MTTVYQCDNCGEVSRSKTWIFHCCECDKEICESCMHGWATCKECAKGKTREELEKRFDENYEITVIT